MGGGRRRGPPCGDKESDGARDARDMAANTMMSANAVTLAASLAGPSLARTSEHLRRPDTPPTAPPTTSALLSAADPSPCARARSAPDLPRAALPAPDPPSLSSSRRHRSSSSSSTNCPSSSPSRRCRSSSSSSASRRRRSRFLLPPLRLRRGWRWMPPPLHALGNGGCAWRERETGVGPLDG